ncbi:MAG: hypothetical protein WAL80_21495 [Xanthobacteraceae bacterium]
MADQDNSSQLIGTASLSRIDKATGTETPVLTKPLYGHPISKQEFGLAPAPGEDHSNFPDDGN